LTPRLRVEALLVAARRVFGPGRDPTLVNALAVETGLHASNVLWALDHALELSPTDEELDSFVRLAPARSAVLVVLAANVFVAPMRAIAWALAQSDRVLVRTSRRAPTFTRALLEAVPALFVELVASGDDPASDIETALTSLPEGSGVHVYGTAQTVATIEALAHRHGVSAELHGPGFGAVVDHDDVIAAHASDIAEDVSAFDQAGCLSPRVVIVIGDVGSAADALDRALGRQGEAIPRHTLDALETASLGSARDAAIYAGRALEGSDHLLLELPTPTLAPAARALVLTGARDVADAIAKARTLGPELATVGTTLPEVASAFAHLRIAPPGRMQRPPLDGPVDRRVL